MHLSANSTLWSVIFVPRGRYWLLDIKTLGLIGSHPTIFDIGANIGQTAHDLRIFYPKAQIYCFEPVSASFEELHKRYSNQKNFHLIKAALGSATGQSEILLHENSELNTLVRNQPRTDDLTGATELIDIRTLDLFSHQNGIEWIDILKMDVQGWEVEVLRGAQNMIKNRRIPFIFAEVGFRRSDTDMQHFSDLNNFLEAEGYWLGGIYDQFRWGKSKEYVGFANVLYILR